MGGSKAYSVTSVTSALASPADGINVGDVRFKVDTGTFYMAETANPNDALYQNNASIYKVVTSIDAGVGTVSITRMAGAGGEETDGPDVENRGVLNVSIATRRVILRKTDLNYNTMPGAKFDLQRWDLSKVRSCSSSYDPNSDGTDDGAACLFSGELPFGTYLLHETARPSGAAASTGTGADGTWWFVLTVSATETSVTRYATYDAARTAANP